MGDRITEPWLDFSAAYDAPAEFTPDGPTKGSDTLLLYFTSGTTSKPKLVEHTHTSYPVGHLSTMYWIGLQPGDVHLNVASPGWAKHAWSNVFAPWIAEATIFIYNYTKFDADKLLDVIVEKGVSTFCAPPTVWRMLIQADLTRVQVPVRELVGAGEPLNPEVIEQVRDAWGMTIRDGFGQTESTLQIGNPPGQPVKDGSMGRPLPGYPIVLVDPVTGERGDEGEICIDLANRPLGLMVGYKDDAERNDDVMRDGVYHTGDVGSRDADGYITYVGRSDDVFKASDYRISPFELESVLIEHDAVAEAAVVPSPDPLRLAVPKAYVVLSTRYEASRETALAILRHARENLPAYKRVRRLEFYELPEDDLREDPSRRAPRPGGRAAPGPRRAGPGQRVPGRGLPRAAPVTYSFAVVPRYAEIDQQGVVFNGHYLTWFDEAFTGFLDHVGLPYPKLIESGVDVMVVHSELDYGGSVRWRDDARVEVTCERRGTTSFTLGFTVYRSADEVAVVGRNVYVVVVQDPDDRRLEQGPRHPGGARGRSGLRVRQSFSSASWAWSSSSWCRGSSRRGGRSGPRTPRRRASISSAQRACWRAGGVRVRRPRSRSRWSSSARRTASPSSPRRMLSSTRRGNAGSRPG